MASEPLAISAAQFKEHLVGLGDLLAAQALFSGRSQDAILGEIVRAAQYQLSEKSGLSFWVTRYCTRELESQDSLTKGTDFDEYCEPGAYEVANWSNGTGRAKLRRAPLISVTKLMLTLSQAGKIVEVPSGWLNINSWRALVNVIPYGANTLNFSTYYSLVGAISIYRAAASSGNVPCLVHLRATAGLVQRTAQDGSAYDAENPVSDYEDGLVREFQWQIGELACARLQRQLLRYYDKGGASVSFDGLGLSFNPQAMEQSAATKEQSAVQWAAQTLGERAGPRISFF